MGVVGVHGSPEVGSPPPVLSRTIHPAAKVYSHVWIQPFFVTDRLNVAVLPGLPAVKIAVESPLPEVIDHELSVLDTVHVYDVAPVTSVVRKFPADLHTTGVVIGVIKHDQLTAMGSIVNDLVTTQPDPSWMLTE